MRDHGLSAEYRENLDVIIRSGSEHLLGLINDVLEMSKIEAGQHTLNEENFDLYYMLNGLEDMFPTAGLRQKADVAFRPRGGCPAVCTNRPEQTASGLN